MTDKLKQCDCCSEWRRTVRQVWHGNIETFACAMCRGNTEEEELADQYPDEDIRYFTETSKP